MARSPAASIIPALVLMAVLLVVFFIPREVTVPPEESDARHGYYLVHILKPNEQIPESLDVTSANSGCYLTSLPEMAGSFLMLPHPCEPVVRSIEFTSDGFHHRPRQGDFDDSVSDIKGSPHKNGLMLVEMRSNANSAPVRWIMRKATEADVAAAGAKP